ncbi:MAG: hypothetical protein WCP74_10190 [Sphingobacteriia bacterium]|jgi:hypothetical protein
MIQVTSIEHLKELCSINGRAEFFILLAGGLCRSSKDIHYDEKTKKFDIYNGIYDTWQEDLTEQELHIQTIIPEAIEKGAMYFEGVQLFGIQ